MLGYLVLVLILICHHSSLSSDEEVTFNFPERELENLLDNFDDDMGMAEFLAEIDEADEQIEIEPEASQVNKNVDPLDLSFQPNQNTTFLHVVLILIQKNGQDLFQY